MKAKELPREKIDQLVEGIVYILYPPHNVNEAWSPSTLDAIADLLEHYGLVPEGVGVYEDEEDDDHA